MPYTPTIGLEIHAELKTRTKMFCNSKNDPDESRPNVNICPVCLAHPGVLPVINKEAVKHVLKVGMAVSGSRADFTEFDRKNYFYPDLPKGYQISQYKHPLIKGGTLEGVDITRIHLEEDTARSTHDAGDYSLVDFNRAGVPLMELVTEPVVKNSEQAVRFAKEFQLILRYLSAGDANMEKGEMRVEANISVSDSKEFGTKVEVKNLNSFRAVERAIAYEIKRQTKMLETGGVIVQETRGWDENKQQTFSQRKKEESHDYRYFPEPDLPKLYISEIPEFSEEVLKREIPELPKDKRDRYRKKFGIKESDVEILIQNSFLGNLFEETATYTKLNKDTMQIIANYITSDLIGLTHDPMVASVRFTSKAFGNLIEMVVKGAISSRGAKDILAILVREGGDPQKIAQKQNLLQQSDEKALEGVVQSILSAHESVVLDYKNGKDSALQFLIGQGMKETKGSANPSVLKKLFLKRIS